MKEIFHYNHLCKGHLTSLTFKGGENMAQKNLDLKGLPCPQPTLKLTIEANSCNLGDVIEAIADCPTFADDVKNWCQRMKKTLLWIREEGGGVKRVQIQI